MKIIVFNVENFYEKIDNFYLNKEMPNQEELNFLGLSIENTTYPMEDHEHIEYVKNLCQKTLSFHHKSNARKKFVTRLWDSMSQETWKIFGEYAENFYGFNPADFIDEKFISPHV